MISYKQLLSLLPVLSEPPSLVASAPAWWDMWVRPVPGLEVASESFQVYCREVGTDAFSQPPLALCCAGAARLRELISEVFSSHPSDRRTKQNHRTLMMRKLAVTDAFDF